MSNSALPRWLTPKNRPVVLIPIVFAAAYVGYSLGPTVAAPLSVTSDLAVDAVGAGVGLLLAIATYLLVDLTIRTVRSSE